MSIFCLFTRDLICICKYLVCVKIKLGFTAFKRFDRYFILYFCLLNDSKTIKYKKINNNKVALFFFHLSQKQNGDKILLYTDSCVHLLEYNQKVKFIIIPF